MMKNDIKWQENKRLTCNVTKFSIFTDLVWWPGTNRVSIDINNGLLPHVQPDNGAILGPFVSTGLLNGSREAFLGGLTTAKDLVSRDSPEEDSAFCFLKSRFFKNCELYWSNLPQSSNCGRELDQKSGVQIPVGEGQIFCHFSFFLFLFHFVHKKLNIKT